MKEHDCGKDPEELGAYGTAITLPICAEDNEDSWWIGNGEYESQVYYCPWCGEKL